jgi:hypothetical protein
VKRQFFGAAVTLLLSSGLALAEAADTKPHHLILISYLSVGDGPLVANPISVTKLDGTYKGLKACKDAASVGAQRAANIGDPGGRAFGNLAAYLFCVPAE